MWSTGRTEFLRNRDLAPPERVRFRPRLFPRARMARRAVGGLSLPELMIACTLLMLVTGFAFKALQYAIAYQKRMDAQQQQLGKVLSILGQVGAEIEESRIGTVLIQPSALIFLLARDADGAVTNDPNSGDLLWSLAVCFQLEQGNLVRKQSPLSTPAAQTLNPLDLSMGLPHFAAIPATRTVARGCTILEAAYSDRLGNVGTSTDGTAAGYVPPTPIAGQPEPEDYPGLIEIRLRVEEKGDRTYATQVQSSVYPRN